MKDLISKFSGVIELRIIRLVAAVAAASVFHASVDVLGMGYVASPAGVTALVFLTVYAGLRLPAQGLAALSIIPALFVVSFAMFARDMMFFVAEMGFESAPAMAWSVLYGPYPGISYFMSDARILGAGKSIGWIQAALYLVVLSVADSVTARKIEDVDLYMKVNMSARAGSFECVAMGCLAVLAVEATPFGGVVSLVAFVAGFMVTLKVPAVSGGISAASKLVASVASRPRFAAAPKGASVTDAVAQPPAPSGDNAVLPRKKGAAQPAEAIPSLQETLAARGKDASRGIAIASGESRKRALELGSTSADEDIEPEPEVDTSDDEILLRSAAAMEEARQPVLMAFLSARILPILADVGRIERLRRDRALRMVIDSVAEFPDDLAGASDRYMAILESGSPRPTESKEQREEGDDFEDGGLVADSPAESDDDGFMSAEDLLADLSRSPVSVDAARAGVAGADLGVPEDQDVSSGIESTSDIGGVVYGAGHDMFEDIVDASEYVGEIAGMEAGVLAVADLPEDPGGSDEFVGEPSDAADDDGPALRPAFPGLEPEHPGEVRFAPGASDDAPGDADLGAPDVQAAADDFEFEDAVAADGAGTVAEADVSPAAAAVVAEVVEMERPVAPVALRRAVSDELLFSKVIPMTDQEVLSVGSRKIKSFASGSLSAFANGLADVVLSMRLGGHDEEEAIELILERIPNGLDKMLDQARFLFGAVGQAVGYSEQDRRLAKRRIAFLLTGEYRRQRLADIDAALKLIEQGSPVSRADAEDALRYVEGVCEMFPQLADQETGADRYAVARALLSERVQEEARRVKGSSALEIGAQRMRDVAAGKGRAVLEAAPSKVKSLVAHLEALRGFFDHLISKASFDSARERRDVADHETREAADEVLALGQMAYRQLEADKSFVESVVRAVRPMTGEAEILSEFSRIIGPDAHGFFETVMLEQRVPMRRRMADLQARLADAEMRAGEGTGAMRAIRAAFEQGLKDPVDVVLERVAAESSMSGEEIVTNGFPIMRAISLPGGGRLLTYSHAASKARLCGYLPVYGMGGAWSASQGDGDDFVLSPATAGVGSVSLRAFSEANARWLSEAGVADVKILLVNGALDSESADSSVRSLGLGDAWDGDGTAMRSTPIKGNVLLMEDLAVRFSEPAVKFGMAAKSGFHRHYEKIVD